MVLRVSSLEQSNQPVNHVLNWGFIIIITRSSRPLLIISTSQVVVYSEEEEVREFLSPVNPLYRVAF